MTCGWTDMIGVVDLRSLGFLQNKARGTLRTFRQTLSFQISRDVCNQYNRFMNLMRKEEEKFQRKIPLVRGH